MGILDNFEKGLERVVNGAFAKTFKSGLQPLEVTAALRKALMDIQYGRAEDTHGWMRRLV